MYPFISFLVYFYIFITKERKIFPLDDFPYKFSAFIRLTVTVQCQKNPLENKEKSLNNPQVIMFGTFYSYQVLCLKISPYTYFIP